MDNNQAQQAQQARTKCAASLYSNPLFKILLHLTLQAPRYISNWYPGEPGTCKTGEPHNHEIRTPTLEWLRLMRHATCFSIETPQCSHNAASAHGRGRRMGGVPPINKMSQDNGETFCRRQPRSLHPEAAGSTARCTALWRSLWQIQRNKYTAKPSSNHVAPKANHNGFANSSPRACGEP